MAVDIYNKNKINNLLVTQAVQSMFKIKATAIFFASEEETKINTPGTQSTRLLDNALSNPNSRVSNEVSPHSDRETN